MPDHTERIRSIYEAVAQGNFTVLVDALHEGVEWRTAAHAPFFGRDAVVVGVRERIGAFDGFAIDVRRIVGSGGPVVLVEARFRGTAKRTGRVLDAQVAHVWDFRDGKIIRFHEYTDTHQFAEVTGTGT